MANRDLAMEKLKEGNVNAASELFQVLTFPLKIIRSFFILFYHLGSALSSL